MGVYLHSCTDCSGENMNCSSLLCSSTVTNRDYYAAEDSFLLLEQKKKLSCTLALK